MARFALAGFLTMWGCRYGHLDADIDRAQAALVTSLGGVVQEPWRLSAQGWDAHHCGGDRPPHRLGLHPGRGGAPGMRRRAGYGILGLIGLLAALLGANP